jgi:hypothetical protein
MKKRILTILGVGLVAVVSTLHLNAQAAPKQYYIVISSMHANLSVDQATLKSVEQEYFDKVTSKNNLIMAANTLTHYFTENSSEILLVSVYNSWEDIDKADAVTEELIAKAWPDEKERKIFLDKYKNIYSTYHSDEIYISANKLGVKQPSGSSKTPVIIYLRKSDMSMAEKQGQWNAVAEYNEKVVMNNPFVLAYYPQRHYMGADSREFLEYFVYNSLTDLDNANAKEEALLKEAWPNETKRKAFLDLIGKAFTGKHGDYIYHNEPTMSK